MLRLRVLGVCLAVLAGAVPARAGCTEGVLPSGALALYCLPSAWNGDLLIYAHGYVAPTEPVALQHLTAPDGTSVPDFVQSLGFAFATTSYRANGLVVLDAIEDVQQLAAAFPQVAGRPAGRTYLVGVSEGGAVAALAVERPGAVFQGALLMCGPYGDFRRQIEYIADFRALFDYYYPRVLPGSPVEVPDAAPASWSALSAQVVAAVTARPEAAAELLAVAGAPPPAAGPTTTTAQYALWYNVFATNDARVRLGGNPYDNRSRAYSGSSNDAALNVGIARFSADAAALASLSAYQTTGRAAVPLVVMHTTQDPAVPYVQATLYEAKARAAGSNVTLLPVEEYGHCSFNSGHILLAFATLVEKVQAR